ncbi:MAG: dienelactone hydrolase family protein [Pseudomonadota bacterium]
MARSPRHFDYQHDGLTMDALLVAPDGVEQSRPAVLIAHAWGGRSDFEEERAQAIAALGYVGIAIDVYGKGVRGSNADENTALMQPLLDNRQRLQARLQAALAAAREQAEVDGTRVAAIGYCFGGLCVLDLARSGTDVAGVVSLHGLFHPPEQYGLPPQITAKVLVLHGYDDPMAPPEAMVGLAGELTQAKADWQIHAYGHTLHSFSKPGANDPGAGIAYSEDAERRSWIAVQSFLAELFP